jgi:hypothetical protein
LRDGGVAMKNILGVSQIISTKNLTSSYKVTTTAKDWASTGGANHAVTNGSFFLVDEIAPNVATNGVRPTDDPGYYHEPNPVGTYLRSANMMNYPKYVSVTAEDRPDDRWLGKFGPRFRLDTAVSTVNLTGPTGVGAIPLVFGAAWTRPTNSDLNNNFIGTINSTPPPPVYPNQDYIGNQIEGRYSIVLHLEDDFTSGFGSPNVLNATYYFYNDVTPPRMQSWSPYSTIPIPGGSITSNFSNIQAVLEDPDLRDGYSGSGINTATSHIDAYLQLFDDDTPLGIWTPSSGSISSTKQFTGPQGQPLAGKVVDVFEVRVISTSPLRRIFHKIGTTIIINPSPNSMSLTGLTGSQYVLGWPISCIPTATIMDAEGNVAAIGSTPNPVITQNGRYFGNVHVVDNVGNSTQVESIDFEYQAPTGTIVLVANPHIILADGTSTSLITGTFTDSVLDNTLVTVSASSFVTITNADQDPITDGLQVKTSGGTISFTVRSQASQAGVVTLSATSISGFANSGPITNQLEVVLDQLYSGVLTVTPPMEKLPAGYSIQAVSNKLNDMQSGVDSITLTFPAGTGLPLSIGNGVMTLNSAGVTAPSVSGQTITFALPVDIPRDTAFTLVIPLSAGITNPKAGHYELQFKSTQDQSAAALAYDILFTIPEETLIPAPNPCSGNVVRFFFNLSRPASVRIDLLNFVGETAGRINAHFAAAGKGYVMDWNASKVAPGVYWAVLKAEYDNGKKVVFPKRKVVIIK